jgi:hypothetical protein
MEYKVCRVCGENKPISEYYKDKTGYVSPSCKVCVCVRTRQNQIKHSEKRKAYLKDYYLKHKNAAEQRRNNYKLQIEALKTPCVKCGETRLYVIDFHHIDPATKSFNINRKIAKTHFEVIKAEVSKCVCLCRNCHMEFHYFYGMQPDDPQKALKQYLNTTNKETKA